MAFAEPITIKDAVSAVDKKEYLLPSIQREFVWKTEQIEKLFDSLMREYPINSFLFWEVSKENLSNYQFYEFVRDYHERDNRHNQKANLKGTNSITAILDGQQRLTSLYIGLKGSYAYKMPRMRWDNNDAFPKRLLCINLLSKPEDDDLEFNFKFLTKEEYSIKDDNNLWFVVGDILEFSSLADVNNYLIKSGVFQKEEKKAVFANETLCKLFQVINMNKSINFFLEKSETLDKVLNIFIRVNSGGTPLSYSDLLLSIATAEWSDLDAREVINSFVDEINNLGAGFNIDKDFVLKSCLVISDIKDIKFSVDNFNNKNMEIIENNWDSISESIKIAYILMDSFGYNRDTLKSNNAVIPIAYYINKIGNPVNFQIASKYEKDRELIKKWLVISTLKQHFSSHPDNILRFLREIIKNDNTNGFPFDVIVQKSKGGIYSFTMDDDEIENIFCFKYGQAYTYSILSILYPTLDFKNKFHEDHIFPKTMFTEKKLLKQGVLNSKIEFYLNNYNYLANLQLLEGVPNQEKSKTPFDKWINEKYKDKDERLSYMKKNYIPECNFEISNFEEFIEKRKKLLRKTIKEILK